MKYTLICLLALIIFLNVLRLHVINILNSDIESYTQIQIDIVTVKNENLQLGQELIQMGALTTIEKEAKARGFIPVVKYIYL